VTPGRALACAVVAIMGGVLMGLGGVLFVDGRNGRVGNALLVLLGVLMLAVVVLAIVYRG